MNRAELVRLRRCRLLLLAMAFGLLLPILEWSWITLAVALAGEAILGFLWWRRCRGAFDGGERSGAG
ncbi:MAG TPA: hypothetical protein VHK22_01915 [Gaiellaceae bacterium]|jgi:hypothetical protein|nr:hypothetical protein [Gaiellaceae bacterium]